MTLFEKLPEQGPAEMTKTAFAVHLGVSAGRVSQMITSGLPVLANGKVPVDAADAWYRANIRQKANGAKHSANQLSDIRVQHEGARRDLLLMDIKQRSGVLIDRKAVEVALFDRARAERDAHTAWVSRVAPVIAAELGVDLSNLFAALDREMRQHLQELSETPLSELMPDA